MTFHAKVDVVTAEIVRSGLGSAALEMSTTLVRTAHNPLLYEACDFGVAIVSSDGQLWAEGAGGITTFLGALPDTIRSGLSRHGTGGFVDGDVVIANDPYLTGSHISDVSIYVPVFHEGELVAFAAATAHWADIGGKTPGGWCPDSTDVYQEGICFSHQKLVAGGARNQDLWEVIENNVRFPTTVLGDLEAQIAACRQGAIRIHHLCAKYGMETVRNSMAFVIARTAKAIRGQIRALPDGVYAGAIELDSDGVVSDVRPRVSLTLRVAGDRIRASFEGTSVATPGPINEPAIATRADIRAALKGLLMPLDPANEGHFAVEFDLPSGLVLSPERPSPCDSWGYVGVALMNLVFRALANAVPDRCPAGGYQLFGIYLFRVDPHGGSPFILVDPAIGGDGARPHGDGPTLIFVGDGNVSNTPIEVLEQRYPIRCDRYSFHPAVAGAGTYRGGLGTRRDYRICERGTYMQIALENSRSPTAAGVGGGTDGEPSVVVVWPDSEKEQYVRERVSYFGPLEVGDVVSVRSGGGGGHGNPLKREPQQVAEDVRDEIISAAAAAATYGVVIESTDGAVIVDQSATAKLRKAIEERHAQGIV